VRNICRDLGVDAPSGGEASGLLDALDAFEQLRLRARQGAVFETDELHALARDLRSQMLSDPKIEER
jgi:hypothetical protein